MYKKLFILIAFFITFSYVNAQISHGGFPLSLKNKNIKNNTTLIDVPVDRKKIDKSLEKARNNCLEHVGTLIDIEYKSNEIGNWTKALDGTEIYTVAFRLSEASGISILFSDIQLPEGANLFFYNENGETILGAFNNSNILTDGSFFIEAITENVIYMEYSNYNDSNKDFWFTIEGFGYFFETDFFRDTKSSLFGNSGHCNVNINCSEGYDIKTIANAIVKIVLLGSGNYYLCTGTLMNNTNEDRTPYLLTAWHCAQETRPAEFKNWTFYFQYQSATCDNPLAEPQHKTLIGCDALAFSEKYGFIQKSDFYLLRLLDNNIPHDYNPYFAGWSLSEIAPLKAKSVHHPKGDIKKVSTSSNISSTSWTKNSKDITHWKVYWDKTVNGHGVTEGGSSGAPLFNAEGLVIGTLSGGTASCENLDGYDKYGMMSYSWNKNGNDSTSRLDLWLDPLATGVTEFHGYNDEISIFSLNPYVNNAEISTNEPTIVIGDKISFKPNYGLSPDSCYWEFEGGEPANSTEINPANIKYNKVGKYDITVKIVKEGHQAKKITYNDFIIVSPAVYPVPFQNMITVVLSKNTVEDINTKNYKTCRLISMDSKESYIPSHINFFNNKMTLYFDNIINGMYILQLISDTDKINLLIGKH